MWEGDYLELVDELVHRWSSLVTPIFGNGKRPGEMEGVGSGFVLSHMGKFYLVTARHVVETLKNQYEHQVVNIFGKGLHLGGRGFKTDESFDIAITDLSYSELKSLGFEKIQSFPLMTDSSWMPTGVFVVMGYPASKNILNVKYGKIDRKLHSFTVGLCTTANVPTNIVNAIVFDYDRNGMLYSNQSLAAPPALRGMSGGPALQVVVNNNGTTPRVGLSLYGVLCEWHEKRCAIVAAPSAAIAELISWSPL